MLLLKRQQINGMNQFLSAALVVDALKCTNKNYKLLTTLKSGGFYCYVLMVNFSFSGSNIYPSNQRLIYTSQNYFNNNLGNYLEICDHCTFISSVLER